MKLTNLLFAAAALWLTGVAAQAQERIVLAENLNGFEIAYQIQLLETKKDKDEYQIIGYVTNKSGAVLYSRNTSPYHIEVSNANSLTKASKPTAKNSQYVGVDMTPIYMIAAGETVQDQAKIKVPAGSKPIVNYRVEGQFVTAENIPVGINQMLVNGVWRSAAGTAFNLAFDAATGTVTQQSTGALVRWYRGTSNNILTRNFVGAVLNGAIADPNAFYQSTITFTGMNKAVYTNNEGITVELTKD